MAEIQPFHGILFDARRVNAADVLTQPYDKITPEMREQYLRRSPWNLVRIELGTDEPSDTAAANKYTRARDLHQAWRREGILRRSPRPSIYWLEQTFRPPPGLVHASADGTLTRRGLIARVRLSPWEEGRILPHERTLSKPKADRLALLRACGAQQGQIFLLHPTPHPEIRSLLEGRFDRSAPSIQCVDEFQATNRLWEVSDPAAIGAVQEALRDPSFYVADGHHRYETALAYRDECRAAAARPDPDAPSEFVMATLVDLADPGLVVLPTHRTVGHLEGFDRNRFRARLAEEFGIESQPSLGRLLEAMRSARPGNGGRGLVIGMYDGNGFDLLRFLDPARLAPLFARKPPLWHTLEVAILHVGILEALLGVDDARLREQSNVSYWRDAEQAVDQVKAGLAQLAFFLNPTPVAAVREIADARSRMPQKSTDFYPKLLSGLVLYEVHPPAADGR